MARVWLIWGATAAPIYCVDQISWINVQFRILPFRSTDFTQYIFANMTPLRLICGLIIPPCRSPGYFSCGLFYFFGQKRANKKLYITHAAKGFVFVMLLPREISPTVYKQECMKDQSCSWVTLDKGRYRGTKISPIQCISVTSHSKVRISSLILCCHYHWLNIALPQKYTSSIFSAIL